MKSLLRLIAQYHRLRVWWHEVEHANACKLLADAGVEFHRAAALSDHTARELDAAKCDAMSAGFAVVRCERRRVFGQ